MLWFDGAMAIDARPMFAGDSTLVQVCGLDVSSARYTAACTKLPHAANTLARARSVWIARSMQPLTLVLSNIFAHVAPASVERNMPVRVAAYRRWLEPFDMTIFCT